MPPYVAYFSVFKEIAYCLKVACLKFTNHILLEGTSETIDLRECNMLSLKVLIQLYLLPAFLTLKYIFVWGQGNEKIGTTGSVIVFQPLKERRNWLIR